MAQLDLTRFLERLEDKLESVDDIRRIASINIAEEAIDLIKQGFVDETNPYGERWAPKKRPDGRKVLSGETSRLKTGWHRAAADKGGFKIAPSVNYAVYHQDPQPRKRGAGSIPEDYIGPMALTRPARKMIPDERGLPKRWSDAFEEVAIDVFRAHFNV